MDPAAEREINREKEEEGEGDGEGVEEVVAKKQGEEEEEASCSDKELDELLDFSLGEFGKHVPATTPVSLQKPPPAPHPPGSEQSSGGQAAGHGADAPSTSGTEDFEDIFSEEFAAQAQAQLGEAMKLLSKEDPRLWQQLQGFTDAAAHNLQSAPDRGGRERESGEGGSGEGGSAEGGSVEATLEDTIRRLRESAEQIESSSTGQGDEELPERLSQLLSQLGEGEGGEGEEGEEGLVKMMEGMMGTLLSRDVLYPSLTEICKQYPGWLSSQRSRLSPEEYSRYCKQLEIMRAICQEFEREEGEGGRSRGAEGGGRGAVEGSNNHFDRILQLMQQLQQYGQPPPEIAGDMLPQGGLPGFPPGALPGGPMPADCSIM